MEKKKKFKLTILDIALIGLMTAVIVVSKEMLSFLPNIELVSFWMIMFTLFFGWRIIFVVPVFVFIEGFIYGINLWWIMYLYAWPLLALLAYIFRKRTEILFWCILSAAYGLCFGLLCSLPYLVIGTTKNGILGGIHAAFTWWIAGIPFDIVHCVGNFFVMLFLYKPVLHVMNRMKKSLSY